MTLQAAGKGVDCPQVSTVPGPRRLTRSSIAMIVGGDAPGTFLDGPKAVQPLHLSVVEKRQLKKFLKTLTGDPVPERYLRDLHNR